ncbi:hypothetical protein RAC89_14655 [Paenibacillus sp. GD4]|uniref:hypothetical protein n=1 Tax=Paenibacillus sp. GD4 TaxID=3068890 RepID=UPI002796D026|nr:hypothetical protein [Paenibacillus sp. GD4]MDQ1911648.1 hypothetical protein [Paenibacillus sp. GD4]
MSEQILGQILEELRGMNGQLTSLNERVSSLEHQFQEFRVEVRTDLQVLKAGQQGLRKEITDRFKEVDERFHRHEFTDDVLNRNILRLETELQMLKEKK